MQSKNIFDECGEETKFELQGFRVDPIGFIVNTVPPLGEDISGSMIRRYEKYLLLPIGFDYVGKNSNELERAVKELCHRIGKARD